MIELPWPDPKLVGQNNGAWYGKTDTIRKHRKWAQLATLASAASVAEKGDIRVSATFYPPHRRGDRVSYPNLLKPYWDGIADALGCNDSRFLPTFHYAEPCSPGKVVVCIRSQPEGTTPNTRLEPDA